MLSGIRLLFVVKLVLLTSIGDLYAETYNDMSVYHLPTSWLNQHGEELSFHSFQGEVLVVVMIYTSCKSACPAMIASLKNLDSKVKQKVGHHPKYILVSIDPKTDKVERLKKISTQYDMDDEQWVWLRGDEDSTRELANVLAVKYKKISPIDFSHSNIISVFDKEGVLRYQKEGLNLDSEETLSAIIKLMNIKN